MLNKDDPFNAKHAEFLLSIAETRAIAKSGEKVGLTPSASSRLLEKYRKFFGDPLFVLSKGALLPTVFFLQIKPRLQDLVELSHNLRNKEFYLPACEEHFKFSCSPGFAPSLMAYVLPRVMKEAPLCSIEHVSISDNPLSVLMSGDIDLLIGRAVGLPPQAHYSDLKAGKRCILLRKDHPLCEMAQKKELTEKDLTDFRRVSLSSGRKQDWLSPDDEIFSGRNKNSNIFFKTDRPDMAWQAMTKSDLFLICTTGSAATACTLYPQLTTLPLPHRLHSKAPKMAIIWSDLHHNNPAHKWFRNLFLAWAKETVA